MIVQSPALHVEEYVRNHMSRYLEELTTLCAIDSGSYHKPGIDEVASYLATRLRKLGMETALLEQEHWGNNLYGVIRGTGHGKVLLLGHMDTVYPVGTAALRPVRQDGDMVIGPGVSDMKGCVLSAVYAVEALLALGLHSFGEIRFLCVSDEELSIRHSKDYIEHACQGCDGALVLEAARANGNLVSARKGGSWYKLVARGQSAHAGVEPEKGRNAVLELAHQTLQFQSLNGWREGVTVNAGVISGGIATNVIPDYAEVQFDLRFYAKEDKLATEERWRELMTQKIVEDVELTLEFAPDYRDPMVCTPESTKLLQKAQQIAHNLGFSVDYARTGGVSDANIVSGFGVPVVDGLGPVGGLDHSPQEYLVASSVAPRTALLAGLILEIGA